MTSLYALVRILAAGAVCAAAPQTVRFKTTDGWTIVGLYHPPRKKADVAILVHGVGAGKGEWSGFEPDLWKMGLGTLAIDLRGHGESVKGPSGKKKKTWPQFSDADWESAAKDLKAAVLFLRRRGFKKNHVSIMGGSIGANLASQIVVEMKLPWGVLLSPGESYRGVNLRMGSAPHFCVAASPQDGYAFKTALSLMTEPNVVFLQASSGHGAQMLAHAGFTSRLLSWIKKNAATEK